MTQRIMLMLEIGGIQEYIFGTNNLRVNVGASALVSAVTEEWLPELLSDPPGVGERPPGVPPPPVETVYSGGGNALLLFSDAPGATAADAADAFSRALTTRLLTDAPGLRAVIERLSIDWDADLLPQQLKELRGRLARRKQADAPGLPLMGLGVSAACAFTGEPASRTQRFGPDPAERLTLISASVAARFDAFEKGTGDLKKLLLSNLPANVRPVSDFGDFGTPGESSFIAIVHADGNNMGQRIEKLAAAYDTAGDRATANDAHAIRLADFSRSAHAAALNALRATLATLWNNLSDDETGWQREYTHDRRRLTTAERERLPKAPLEERDGERILPFRPVVFGGDDVTFVCDGRLGLALAHRYLTAYGEQTLADGKPAVGRAGVAIVHSHFPFAQGYALAEALVAAAKDDERTNGGRVAALDWHYGVNGVVSGLGELRAAGYEVGAGNLAARPLLLQPGSDWQHWATFDRLMSDFQTAPEWAGRRNKVKALQQALRDGQNATQAFRENYRLPALPDVPGYPGLAQQGWAGGRTPYFDALEMLDLFIPLDREDTTT